ncbi:GMC family oxidoreductase [Mesorhizobium sp. YR577]|uniref:GMC oxidoreductase n=1 Tax=Mesorhizobium sp. YR577 TaxID=1884373 RepID=UPI0008F2FEE2|nr:GMC family oxidoreductase [Mesorhizobium sp. YR577]SFU09363.1 Choline dehydrogenase [Mesorhizobium sp. YR577]
MDSIDKPIRVCVHRGMSIYNLSELENDCSRSTAPLCVIGAGIAGLLFARRVAKKGQRVIVVESGYASYDPAIHALNEIEDPAERYSRALTGRYRGLGGTSSRWGGRMIPIGKHETEARPYLQQQRWPIAVDPLESYHDEIEKIFKVGDGPFRGNVISDEITSKYFPVEDKSLLNRWAKVPSFKNCNVFTLLKDELKELENIEIWLGATVCEFKLDRAAGRLSGIVARNFSGKQLEVSADRFVIAAGTIETTRLLLLMNAASDDNAFRSCRVLGRYFQDHLKSEVATINRRNPSLTNRIFGYRFLNATRRDLHLELTETAQRGDAVASAFAYVAMDLAESPLGYIKKLAHGIQKRQVDPNDLWQASKNMGLVARSAYWRYLRKQLFVPASIDLHLMVCAEQLPQWSNHIRLADKRDRFGVPKAQLEWAPTQTDERTFRSAISHIAGYWERSGMDRVCPLEWSPASSDPALPIIDNAEACAHPSGSTRMGTDPAESVVGPDLRCHAVPNVSVVSASVFPTAGSANPTFTIMKLALWLADSHLQGAPRREHAFVPSEITGSVVSSHEVPAPVARDQFGAA